MFNTFVDPETFIPEKITKLTGITDEMVRGAPRTPDALRAFKEFVKDAVLVAHNANFDMGFVKAGAAGTDISFENPYIDTVALCRFLYPDAKNHKLNTVAEYLRLPPFHHHRASDDAKMLSDIFCCR